MPILCLVESEAPATKYAKTQIFHTISMYLNFWAFRMQCLRQVKTDFSCRVSLKSDKYPFMMPPIIETRVFKTIKGKQRFDNTYQLFHSQTLAKIVFI